MINIISIIGALLLFALLVIVHEAGHFFAARALKIPVEEFAVGMGKVVWQKKSKGVLYSLRLLPLGGFCRFRGDADNMDGEGMFYAEKPWKRLIVFAAGPFVNLAFAFLTAILLFTAFGDYAIAVQEVTQGAPAAEAGMKSVDLMLAVNGKPLRFDYKNLDELSTCDPEKVTITIQRNGEKKDLILTDIYNQEQGKNLIGINMLIGGDRVNYGFFGAVECAWDFVKYNLTMIGETLVSLFQRPQEIVGDLAGPVATVAIMGMAVRGGLEIVLRMTILIGVNLALFNLLPIPGLDGAKLVFTAIEVIFRKPVPRKIEGAITMAGLLMLFALAIFVTFGDLSKLMNLGG